MLRLDFNLVLEMINLVILFLILRKFLFRPVMDIMEKRKTMIADGISNANAQQEQAYALKAQYEQALSGAKDESRRMIEQAKKDARQEYDRIIEDADREAGRLMKDARETMEQEREQTLRDMKTEVGHLAADAAKKLVMQQYGADTGRAVYDQFLKEAGEVHDNE